jgi:O-antigen/teichoic acid export membrane protein
MTSGYDNKRLVKNTILLYARMLLMMAISLYTSRVVLSTLGVDDYGIYNVVGGIVVVLSFLNVSMAGATQRFMNIELGKEDEGGLRKVLSTSLFIHIIIAGIVLLLGETLGLWFLNSQMNIAVQRLVAANWVYQCSLLSFIITIINVPYHATIIAHEQMSAFAYISIVEAILKLLVVFLLLLFPFDKLIVYAILMTIVACGIRVIYGIYCEGHFAECRRISIVPDREYLHSMMTFSGWTVFGTLGALSHTNGIGIIINIFFGVAVNAAQGIANQVIGIVNQFVSNFMTALKPQIIKAYASGDLGGMHSLVKKGSRMGISLVAIFVIPLYFEVPFLLNVWLTEVPEYTVTFIRIILLTSLSSAYAHPLATARAATGIIRNYQIVLTIMAWMHLPLAWLFFKLGFEPPAAMIIYLVIVNIEQIYRIFNVCPAIGLPVAEYVTEVLGRCGLMLVVAFVSSYLIYSNTQRDMLSDIIVLCSSCLIVGSSIIFIALKRTERTSVLKMIKSRGSRN